jgi:hypothetical protein
LGVSAHRIVKQPGTLPHQPQETFVLAPETPGEYAPAHSTSCGHELEIRDLRQQIDKLQREMKQQQLTAIREKNDLIRKTQRLNQMIIKNAQPVKNELSDLDAENAFLEIRQLITGIVRNNFSSPRIIINKHHVKELGEDRFYHKLETMAVETRRRVLISTIFRTIKLQAFDVKCFGLDDSMETCMQDFEKMIQGSVKSKQSVRLPREMLTFPSTS